MKGNTHTVTCVVDSVTWAERLDLRSGSRSSGGRNECLDGPPVHCERSVHRLQEFEINLRVRRTTLGAARRNLGEIDCYFVERFQFNLSTRNIVSLDPQKSTFSYKQFHEPHLLCRLPFYARSVVLSTLDSLSSISLTLANRTTTNIDV